MTQLLAIIGIITITCIIQSVLLWLREQDTMRFEASLDTLINGALMAGILIYIYLRP